LGSYLVMFLGQQVPHNNRHHAGAQEKTRIEQWRNEQKKIAATGYSAEQALTLVRRPEWVWTPDFYNF